MIPRSRLFLQPVGLAGLATLLTGLLAGCSEGGPQTCRIDRVADLPLLPGSRLPAVQATLDGQKVVFYIDTGAVTSLITPEAVRHFGLNDSFRNGSMAIRGVGGVVNAPIVTIHSLILGRGLARNVDLPEAGNLGGAIQGMPIIGLFGADFLSNYDVDLDLPGRHFALYELQACGRRLRPFDQPYFELPFRLENTKVTLDLKLNDTPMTAFLDSGAASTLLTRADARRAGVTMDTMAEDRFGHAVGIDLNPIEVHLHRFASLEIGLERMQNFRLAVADIDDSLLGDDFLHLNRVWISYPLQRLFIQPASPRPAGPDAIR